MKCLFGWKPEQIHRLYPSFKDWNEDLKAQNDVMPKLPQLHPRIEEYKRLVQKLCNLNVRKESLSPYMQWKSKSVYRKGFLLNEINREIRELIKSDWKNVELVKSKAGGDIKIADLAITALSKMESKNKGGILLETVYRQIACDLGDSYKPYQDKMKVAKRFKSRRIRW